MIAPDCFRNAAAKRYVLNAVKSIITTSNANGMAKAEKAVKDMPIERHTPDNGSYTKFSADSESSFR
jgi:hypothetical protein